MLKKLYEHCKSDVAATNNKEFRRTLQYTVKCDICDMCCKILHSPFLIHRHVPSESDISRYIEACRASAIYGIAIYWRYTHKRVPALVYTLNPEPNNGKLRMMIRAGTLLWVYRQYIVMPYIALARQAWIYRDISDSLGTRLSIKE